MTLGPMDLPETGPRLVHTLTVETVALAADGYRLVATCDCLHFARSVLAPNRAGADLALTLVDTAHAAHIANIEAGRGVVTDPATLPEEWA